MNKNFILSQIRRNPLLLPMMMNPAAGVQVKQPVYAGNILHRGRGWGCVGVGDHRKPSRVACGGGSISRPQPIATTRIKGTTPPPMASGKGNPCLDLWFDEAHLAAVPVGPGGGGENVLGSFSRQHLTDQLLPAAWSHNPLTTLKLIFCFLDMGNDVVDDCKFNKESFYAAAYWLHQNHPKTLASNLPTIAGGSSFGNLLTVQRILFRIRLLEVCQGRQHDPKAAADYRFLHDRVADLFAHCLKHDIHNLNKHLRNRLNSNNNNKQVDEEDDDDYCLELSYAANWCPFRKGGESIGLYESIARKVFPQELYPEYQGLDEATYSLQVQERLEVDILEPLERVIGRRGVEQDPGYKVVGNQEEEEEDEEESCNKKYLEKLASEETTTMTISLPAADALLPHEIVEYVEDKELGKAAELQWKTMVEHMKDKEEGKLISNWNCLAVCDPFGYGYREWRNASLALTTLVSQLAQEPWKGKVISCNRNPPQLHTIGDDHHLRSTCSFLEGMNRRDGDFIIDIKNVFDLILQVAVNENLKPDQMIKRVFVLTARSGDGFYHEVISVSERWETHDYEAIKSRFKVEGYDLPHLVFWSLAGRSGYLPVPCSAHNGMTILSGFNDCLVKSFVDNHGDIGLDHVMEVAISPQQYQDLVVVD